MDIESVLTTVQQAIRAGDNVTSEQMDAATNALNWLKGEVQTNLVAREYLDHLATEEKNLRRHYGNEYYEKHIAPQKYPWRYENQPVNVDGIENQRDQLATQMVELSKHSENLPHMEEIKRQMDKLDKDEAQAIAKNRQLYLQSFSGELSQLNQDIENITKRIETLSKNSSSVKNGQIELDQLAAQLDRRMARVEQIEAGEGYNLQWTPPKSE